MKLTRRDVPCAERPTMPGVPFAGDFSRPAQRVRVHSTGVKSCRPDSSRLRQGASKGSGTSAGARRALRLQRLRSTLRVTPAAVRPPSTSTLPSFSTIVRGSSIDEPDTHCEAASSRMSTEVTGATFAIFPPAPASLPPRTRLDQVEQRFSSDRIVALRLGLSRTSCGADSDAGSSGD